MSKWFTNSLWQSRGSSNWENHRWKTRRLRKHPLSRAVSYRSNKRTLWRVWIRSRVHGPSSALNESSRLKIHLCWRLHRIHPKTLISWWLRCLKNLNRLIMLLTYSRLSRYWVQIHSKIASSYQLLIWFKIKTNWASCRFKRIQLMWTHQLNRPRMTELLL